MERLIKFRGKNTAGRWHYGDLHTFEGISIVTVDSWEVNPDTVGQFTGFVDVDGKEIFEGDIIQNQPYPELIYKVEWHTDCWVGVYDDDGFLLGNLLDAAPFKVIGNAFDNPELLEGGADDD